MGGCNSAIEGCTCGALSILCLGLQEVAVEGVAQGAVEGGRGNVAAVQALEADQAVKVLEADAIQQLPCRTCAYINVGQNLPKSRDQQGEQSLCLCKNKQARASVAISRTWHCFLRLGPSWSLQELH